MVESKDPRNMDARELSEALEKAVGPLPEETALTMARRIAIQVLKLYGEGDKYEAECVARNDIWNDHPAVQASLATLNEIVKHATEGEDREDTTEG